MSTCTESTSGATTTVKGTGDVPTAAEDGGYHIPNIPLWTRWALGSILSYAIPFYKGALRIEDSIEKTGDSLAEDVEKVALVVEKVATDIASSLPKDSIVEHDFVLVEHFAEEAIEEAKKAEAFIQKMDKMKEKVEKEVDPYVKEGEEFMEEQENSK